MADLRFFKRAGPFSLGALAEIAKATLREGDAPALMVEDVAPLGAADPSTISFLDNKLYIDAFTQSKAGACIVHPDFADRAPQGMALLLSPEPYRAYARVAQVFYPVADITPAVHATAEIDPSVTLGEGCRIDAGVVIEAGATIGAGSHIGANTFVGQGVLIGAGCRISPMVTLAVCELGAQCIIHTGVRIGQDGFGFAPGADGHLKVPQLGRVIIGNGVEIGANTTIDRGTGPDTVIGDGTKIDNLVQIGHNVEIGRACLVVAQVGISGSTKIGDFAMIGGQAGLAGHLNIGAGVRIAAQSGVMRDINPGVTVAGSPALPAKEYWRQIAMLARQSKSKVKKGD